jgi:chromate reductase
MSVRLLGLSGSLRHASWSTALLRAAARLTPDDVLLEVRTLHDVPLYDADLQPVPAGVLALKAAVAAADAVVIATPEYNHSIPGVLKNALDWASRPVGDGPFVGKAAGVISASPGAVGGARAQAHAKDVLLALGAHVLPGREVVVAQVDRKVTPDGELTDAATRDFLGAWLRDLAVFAARLRNPADRT